MKNTFIFGLMYKISRKIPGFNKWMGTIYSCDIPRKAKLGKDIYFPHNALGVVINANAKVGDNVVINHHVTIGVNKESGKAPTIGNNVTLGVYSMILGDITIGDNSVIGAGSIVMKDIPPNTVYFNHRDEVFKSIEE